MSVLDDARRLAAVDPWYEHERAGTSFCIACGAYESHNPDCPWLSMPRIVAALELIDRFGFTFEQQDDGLHMIDRPKQRTRISERAVRVMEAAERVVLAHPDPDDAEMSALRFALRDEGSA